MIWGRFDLGPILFGADLTRYQYNYIQKKDDYIGKKQTDFQKLKRWLKIHLSGKRRGEKVAYFACFVLWCTLTKNNIFENWHFFPICPQNSVLTTLGWLLSDQYNVFKIRPKFNNICNLFIKKLWRHRTTRATTFVVHWKSTYTGTCSSIGKWKKSFLF